MSIQCLAHIRPMKKEFVVMYGLCISFSTRTPHPPRSPRLRIFPDECVVEQRDTSIFVAPHEFSFRPLAGRRGSAPVPLDRPQFEFQAVVNPAVEQVAPDAQPALQLTPADCEVGLSLDDDDQDCDFSHDPMRPEDRA